MKKLVLVLIVLAALASCDGDTTVITCCDDCDTDTTVVVACTDTTWCIQGDCRVRCTRVWNGTECVFAECDTVYGWCR